MDRWWTREHVVRFSYDRLARRALVWLAILVVAAGSLYLVRAPFLGWIGNQMVHHDPLEHADAIVVLAGGTPSREIEAAALFKAGWAPRVVVPRGPDDAPYNALVSRGMTMELPSDFRLRVLREFGVPPAAVVALTPVVMSTIQEAGSVLDWSTANGVRSLIVVTNAFHTARARYVYQKLGRARGIRTITRATQAEGSDFSGWWKTRGGLAVGLVELQKTLFYRLRY
jgi:uncharacterized SAM-binding protein YcdF (DUF218 family)